MMKSIDKAVLTAVMFFCLPLMSVFLPIEFFRERM